MAKKITRTIKTWRADYFTTKGELMKSITHDVKPRLDKLAQKEIKETGKMDFYIEIVEVEEKRAITLENLMKYSEVIEDDTETEDEE